MCGNMTDLVNVSPNTFETTTEQYQITENSQQKQTENIKTKYSILKISKTESTNVGVKLCNKNVIQMCRDAIVWHACKKKS